MSQVLLVQYSISHKKLLENQRVLHCFKSSPLYTGIDEDTINKLENLYFEEMIAEIPLDLLSEDARNLFLKEIERKKAKNG